jgi:hypothetical protein
MLSDFTPLVDLITNADRAAEIRARLSIAPDLEPVPTVVELHPH